ncbi:hypothetical protein KRP22_008917 [Phytophthora ramorum]|nr:hypothetical protein KRP22_7749 [Phytophthora ramorum]
MEDRHPMKRKRKYRKSTHAILKEEKEALVGDIEALTARLLELKTKAFGAQDEEEDADRRTNSLLCTRWSTSMHSLTLRRGARCTDLPT